MRIRLPFSTSQEIPYPIFYFPKTILNIIHPKRSLLKGFRHVPLLITGVVCKQCPRAANKEINSFALPIGYSKSDCIERLDTYTYKLPIYY